MIYHLPASSPVESLHSTADSLLVERRGLFPGRDVISGSMLPRFLSGDIIRSGVSSVANHSIANGGRLQLLGSSLWVGVEWSFLWLDLSSLEWFLYKKHNRNLEFNLNLKCYDWLWLMWWNQPQTRFRWPACQLFSGIMKEGLRFAPNL